MASDLLKIQEAAEYLRLTVPTLRKWRFEGRLPIYKIGRTIRFSKKDLDSLIENSLQPAKSRAHEFA